MATNPATTPKAPHPLGKLTEEDIQSAERARTNPSPDELARQEAERALADMRRQNAEEDRRRGYRRGF